MNRFQKIFDAQKALFASGVTRTYKWRVEQLDRMARMIKENEGRFQEAIAKDFKTASQEYIFETAASAGETEVQKSQLKEWMKPVEAPVPRFLAETGHKGMIYREPYGVALIIGPFNGPLLLLIRPALAALAAGKSGCSCSTRSRRRGPGTSIASAPAATPTTWRISWSRS